MLAEVQAVAADDVRSAHERYVAIFRLLEKQDGELAVTFNNPRRSQAMIQLAAMKVRKLLLPDELAQVSEGTLEVLARLVGDKA